MTPEMFADLMDLHRQHLIANGALTILLIDKGVFTVEEHIKATAQATCDTDQIMAGQREAARTDSLTVFRGEA